MPVNSYKTIGISGKDNIGINFLYGTIPGRILLKIFIRPFVSGFAGFLMDRKFSALFISKFVKCNSIDVSEYEDTKYRSFNDFFSRNVKKGYRPFPGDMCDLASPCDAKLTAYPITADGVFHIKNSVYNIKGLLKDDTLAQEYLDGVCLIFRLTPDDFHRYSYIDNGEVLSCKKIKGVLHTVRPISHRHYKIYFQNAREYAVLQTENFGKTVQMEVGALFVGRIKNHSETGPFKRGEEKGLFEFGGSTIVMLFQKERVVIDRVIYENTEQDKETIVRQGYKIGAAYKNADEK
ncbi:MAG: phosphatidylserine decarboxylase [Chitinispirillia bacterium]|nr:phosphatidylserine decarboxylase [Chitinispirillia bacterium]